MTSNEIIECVNNLENCKSEDKTKLAEEYLDKYYLRKSIPFSDLVEWFNCGTSKENWFNAFLIEKTIPYIKLRQRPTWFVRLAYFAGSFILEKHIDHSEVNINGKLYKIRFSRLSGDHYNLNPGRGNNAADFYLWDSAKNENMGFLEFKFANKEKFTCPEDVLEYYKGTSALHGAKYVLTLLEKDNKFYIMNPKIKGYSEVDIPQITDYFTTDFIKQIKNPFSQLQEL